MEIENNLSYVNSNTLFRPHIIPEQEINQISENNELTAANDAVLKNK